MSGAMRSASVAMKPGVTAASNWTQFPIIADIGGGIGTELASVRHQDSLDAIQQALDQDRIRREDEKAVSRQRASLDTLTLRECEVMVLVVAGLQNKQIAHELG
jgi:hypothetical protein